MDTADAIYIRCNLVSSRSSAYRMGHVSKGGIKKLNTIEQAKALGMNWTMDSSLIHHIKLSTMWSSRKNEGYLDEICTNLLEYKK